MSNCEIDRMSEIMTNINLVLYYYYRFICFYRDFVLINDCWLLLQWEKAVAAPETLSTGCDLTLHYSVLL